MYKLRDHQTDCIASIKATLGSCSQVCVAAPCGFGKTIVFCEISKRVHDNGKKIIIVMDSIELVKQTKKKMLAFVNESKVGIVCGSLDKKEINKPIVIGTIQSFSSIEDLGKIDCIVLDECHAGISRFQVFVERMNYNGPILGFTATPYSAKGYSIYGKNKFFKSLAYRGDIDQLTKDGYLVPFVYRGTPEESKIDFSHLKLTSTGEYSKKDVIGIYAKNTVKIDMQIKDMLDHIEGRKKIVIMASGIDHAEEIYIKLTKYGFRSVSFHSQHSLDNREIYLNQFKDGDTRFLIGVSAIYKGLDIPKIDCLVLMRPIRSKSFYVQFIGRGSRTYEGKKDCLVLDYGQVIDNLGLYNKIKESDSKKEVKKNEVEAKKDAKACPSCFHINKPSDKTCGNCGESFKDEEAVEKQIEKLESKSSNVIDLKHLENEKDGHYNDEVYHMKAFIKKSTKGHRQVVVEWSTKPNVINLSSRYKLFLTDMPYEWAKSKNKSMAKRLSNSKTDSIYDLPKIINEEGIFPNSMGVYYEGGYVKSIYNPIFNESKNAI